MLLSFLKRNYKVICFILFIHFLILLKYGWFTILYWFQGYSKVIHLYIYVFIYAAKSFQSCPTLCDPWTVTHQAPLSMEFSRQEYWSGWPFPSPKYSYIYIYIYIYMYVCICQFFSRFFSITGNNKVWVQFPTLYIRSLLVIYVIQSCVYFNPKLLTYPLYLSPLGAISLFSVSMSSIFDITQ